ncbi:receptor-type tyrosine-protein phosphatase kappa-like [Mercenaria mercenaria]|uniref:receptor-type tyrosine-protein phosphatase kappa-like n=1 Tax=Mercenaria mercenaria TaxID=6596 RepID=UPI00234F66B7|nr:receptor-type tyrosine-protein phosphatase kappa-like [Mercenaria mercenaria]
MKNCEKCLNAQSCTKCSNGYYGSYCYKCPENCLTCSSMNICESCKTGYYNGRLYDSNSYPVYSDCRHKCQDNCTSCTSYRTCTKCKEGFYNGKQNSTMEYSDCRHQCHGDCKSCSSYNNCTECVYGKYNNIYSNCSETCEQNCKSCSSYDTCTECMDGKYNDINNNCSENCSSNCKACISYDNCSSCQAGKFGTFCQNDCGIGCENHQCDFNGGSCTCILNFQGDRCDQCVNGKYGPNCNITCPSGCLNKSCDINGTCYSCKTGFTGAICNECVRGTYGPDCNITCPLGCANNSCDLSGNCYSCKSMFSGDMCDECVSGKYGTDCDISCPANCNNSSCKSNGECYSCKTGFSGSTCDECVPGNYGTNCDIPCSARCGNKLCRRNGDCYSCISGFSGSRCSQSENASTQTEPDGDNMGVTIGAAAGGGVSVLILISLIVVIVLRKKRKGMGKSEENDMTEIVDKTDHSVMKNSEVLTSGISDETNDPVYAVPNKPKKQVERTKSSDDNTSTKAVSSPNYEKPKTQNDITVMNQNDLKQGDPTPESDFGKTDSRDSVAETTLSQNYPGHLDTLNTEVEEEIDLTAISSNHEMVTAQTASEVVDTYYNVAAVKRRKIMLDQLPDFVSKKTNDDFADEFQQLPPGLIKPYVDSQRRENIAKNRYRGIYPYDCTRIVLRDCSSDYINASYIDGYNKRKAYIASIGPTYKYMGDMSAFWIMVWQEKVGKIVMLTKLDEGGAPKCDQYWPEKGFSLLYANIQVTCQSEETYADYIIRSFTIQKESEKRTSFQVHFTAWPDKGTPDDVTSLIEFRQRVNSVKTELEGPILVHCSAGIGRTGTYIALDSLTEEGEAEGEVDIYAFVRNMREQRVNMMQTAEQYQYLHNALVHTLTFDSKAVEASKFAEYMKSLTEDHLGKKFEKLQASVEQRSDDEIEAVKRNIAMRNKNRDGADIPGDRYRPKLYLDRNPGSSDFINAVYVNSHKAINRFLVAQTPLPDTVVDFLALIVQEKVSCIVSMEANAVDDKTVGTYTVDNQQVKIGTFTVKTHQKLDKDQYVLRTLSISHKGKYGREEVTIPHIQFTHWNDTKNIPGEPAKFVEFVKDVELTYRSNGAKGPILVHCLTGAEKNGIFCAVSILLEKIRIDQEISIVNTIRQIKYRRHNSIPNKDQYIFCHKCVNEYIRSFDSYSNFEMET